MLVLARHESDLVNLGTVESQCSALFCVSENQLVGLGTKDIPRVTAGSEGMAEVGIWSCFSATLMIPGVRGNPQASGLAVILNVAPN